MVSACDLHARELVNVDSPVLQLPVRGRQPEERRRLGTGEQAAYGDDIPADVDRVDAEPGVRESGDDVVEYVPDHALAAWTLIRCQWHVREVWGENPVVGGGVASLEG